MATAQDIIKRAFVTAKIVAATETLTSQDADDGLVYLNDLLEGLSTNSLMIYQNVEESHTMDGSTSYTWGTGGDINTARPLKLVSAYFTDSNSIDAPVTIFTKTQYDSIGDKSITSDYVDYIYLYTDFPLARLYVYPIVSSGTLKLTSWKELTSLASLTTSVSLPPGYNRMLRFALAAEMAPEYGVDPNHVAWLDMKAREAKADIARVNSKLQTQTFCLPAGSSNTANILEGY